MFHKNKRNTKIHPIRKKMGIESGVVVNKNAAMGPRDTKTANSKNPICNPSTNANNHK